MILGMCLESEITASAKMHRGSCEKHGYCDLSSQLREPSRRRLSLHRFATILVPFAATFLALSQEASEPILRASAFQKCCLHLVLHLVDYLCDGAILKARQLVGRLCFTLSYVLSIISKVS